jgi:hypothetical protein
MLTIVRLSLWGAPLFLLACVEDQAVLSTLADEIFERSAAGQQATLMTIDLTQYPDAKCNDGSAPVVKVKLDPNGGTDWLVYLQGGGSCQSTEDCEDRWRDCDPSPAHSEGGRAVGGKDKMMANSNAMNFDGWGILDFDGHDGEVSPFAGKNFNRIFVPYCSSDTWRGLGNTQPVNYAATCGDPNPLTTIHFGGGKIVEAVIDEIMASPRAPQTDGFIVLAGGSAGGAGVQHNLDRVTDQVHALEAGITVVGIADSAFGVGLYQDGIPNEVSLDAEFFWAGLPASYMHNPGDPIDVVVDDSCWNTESGSDKDYCHVTPYTVANYIDNPLMQSSNTFDNVHEDAFATFAARISDCGGENYHTGGVDPDQDALYDAYCDPVVDPANDVETWMRYQIGVEGTAILASDPNHAYFIVHSSQNLHDHFLKHSEDFYRRATDPALINILGGQ